MERYGKDYHSGLDEGSRRGMTDATVQAPRGGRPKIGFFDYPDVFEDFYPRYGVDPEAFATKWRNTGSHRVVETVQRLLGDVTWFALSVAPTGLAPARHTIGCRVVFVRSSLLHRALWWTFYVPHRSWRWRARMPRYRVVLSYVCVPLRLVGMLRRTTPDALLLQDYASGRFDVLVAVARLLRIPVVAFHAGSNPSTYMGPRLKQRTIPALTRIIVSSHSEADMLETRYGVEKSVIDVVLTPIDIEAYAPRDRTAACKALALDDSRRYLAFVGRLDDKVKRVSALIRAMARIARELPDVDLIVVGSGKDQEALHRLAQDLLPDRVRFLGWLSDPLALGAAYNVAEALVLPSISEGFPTVVGEALACGTPVVASDLPGIAEIVDEHVGWLVPPGDDAALVEALRAAASGHHREGMRARARDVALERLAPEAIADALEACFSRAFAEGRG